MLFCFLMTILSLGHCLRISHLKMVKVDFELTPKFCVMRCQTTKLWEAENTALNLVGVSVKFARSICLPFLFLNHCFYFLNHLSRFFLAFDDSLAAYNLHS